MVDKNFTQHDPIEEFLPTEGWLANYVEWGKNLEVCSRFRFFAACSVLGAAINNRVFIQRGAPGLLPKLFPNIWVLLLAPSGQGHKTSTVNMALKILTKAHPQVRILSDKITPEALVKALSAPKTQSELIRIGPRDATGLIKAPELSVFFGKQQYNTGLVSLITDLYDFREEWKSETIMRSQIVLRNVCISVLGGSTPKWLQSMLPQDAFTGGFMSRFAIIEMPPTYLRRVPSPEASMVDVDMLVEGLREVGSHSGEMQWTSDGLKEYEEQYEKMIPSGEEQKDAYMERIPEQTIKLAILLALAQNRLSVGAGDMIKARQIFDCLSKETLPRIDHLSIHPRMRMVQVILGHLDKARDGLTKSELYSLTYKDLSHGEMQFLEAMRILNYTGQIRRDDSRDQSNPTYHVVLKEEG